MILEDICLELFCIGNRLHFPIWILKLFDVGRNDG